MFEDVVIDSVGDWRADEIYHSLIESGRDIESMIDINDFPHLVNRNWGGSFLKEHSMMTKPFEINFG